MSKGFDIILRHFVSSANKLAIAICILFLFALWHTHVATDTIGLLYIL